MIIMWNKPDIIIPRHKRINMERARMMCHHTSIEWCHRPLLINERSLVISPELHSTQNCDYIIMVTTTTYLHIRQPRRMLSTLSGWKGVERMSSGSASVCPKLIEWKWRSTASISSTDKMSMRMRMMSRSLFAGWYETIIIRINCSNILTQFPSCQSTLEGSCGGLSSFNS